ncbi:MAG: AI-2E family transporter [Thermomicrobiales bacterium]|nr:AI-2E family transporter [Thermomicrobiales bacterium]
MRGDRNPDKAPRDAEPSVRKPANRHSGAGEAAAPAAAAAEADRRPGLTPLSLLIVLIIAYLLLQIQFVLVLLLMALVFATVIQKPVEQLERWRLPRPLAILLVYVGIIAGLTVLFVALAPAIREQSQLFRVQAPISLANLRDTWAESSNALLNGPGQQLLDRAIAFINSPASQNVTVPQGAALGILTGVGGGLVGVLTVLVITFYYLMERQWIRRIALSSSAPATRVRVIKIWDEVEQKVGDWLRGQLTLCLVIGVTATVGYGLMGISFWPLLGLWAGVTEIIPILGPWLGGIPAVVIALTQSWEKALMVGAFVALLQLAENTVLVPRIMRGAVGLTPLTVFIAILAGTEFAGIPGALLAIPVSAVIQVLLSNYIQARREARLAGQSALPGWRWMRGSVTPPAFAPAAPEEPAAASPEGPGWTPDLLARVTGSTVGEVAAPNDTPTASGTANDA